MKLKIIAVGRLRKGPELDLIHDYQSRCDKTGRTLSLGPIEIVEVEDKKGGGMAAEADLLSRHIANDDTVVALDERGKVMSSPEFANTLGRFRDDGTRTACFLIGGADGLDPSMRDRADLKLSFGQMVWPHMLVRVMLTEQLYRATSILAGGPYHRV